MRPSAAVARRTAVAQAACADRCALTAAASQAELADAQPARLRGRHARTLLGRHSAPFGFGQAERVVAGLGRPAEEDRSAKASAAEHPLAQRAEVAAVAVWDVESAAVASVLGRCLACQWTSQIRLPPAVTNHAAATVAAEQTPLVRASALIAAGAVEAEELS